MLDLKRRPDQAVLIGKHLHTTGLWTAKLTVLSLIGKRQVQVRLQTSDVVIDAPLTVGGRYAATVDGCALTVYLQAVKPARDGSPGLGEAWLGFDAPRELQIDREEYGRE